MNISKALEIQGYMSEPALQWLAEQASKHSVIVELGSFCGRSTRALADNTPGIVYAIDDWKGVRKTQWGEATSEMAEDGPRSFRAFLYNLADHINADKVIVLRMDHVNATGLEFVDGQPDMVFIDGDHDYESVKRDILIWKEQLIPGGLLCGDDISWPGVRWAVDELVADVVVVENTEIWYRPNA